MLEFKQIGKGSFSTVYRKGNSKNVYIKTNDYVKEAMCLWFENSRLFPKIQHSDIEGFDYKMKYYPKHTSLKLSLKPKEYQKYLLLRDFNGTQDFNILWDTFSTIKIKSLKKNLLDALSALSNYGFDIVFEISPRNVSVSPTGNLVLLDCFYIQSQLKDIRGY